MRPKTGAVEFGRKRVRIDADFADGTLGGQLAAAEAVDEELRAVRAGGGSGERLQIGLQVVRIVGKGFEIFVLQHERADIGRRIDVYLAGRLIADRYLLRLRGNLQCDVKRSGLTVGDIDFRLEEGNETFGIGADRVFSGRDGERELALTVRFSAAGDTVAVDLDGSAGHDRGGGIGYRTADGTRVLSLRRKRRKKEPAPREKRASAIFFS